MEVMEFAERLGIDRGWLYKPARKHLAYRSPHFCASYGYIRLCE